MKIEQQKKNNLVEQIRRLLELVNYSPHPTTNKTQTANGNTTFRSIIFFMQIYSVVSSRQDNIDIQPIV